MTSNFMCILLKFCSYNKIISNIGAAQSIIRRETTIKCPGQTKIRQFMV